MRTNGIGVKAMLVAVLSCTCCFISGNATPIDLGNDTTAAATKTPPTIESILATTDPSVGKENPASSPETEGGEVSSPAVPPDLYRARFVNQRDGRLAGTLVYFLYPEKGKCAMLDRVTDECIAAIKEFGLSGESPALSGDDDPKPVISWKDHKRIFSSFEGVLEDFYMKACPESAYDEAFTRVHMVGVPACRHYYNMREEASLELKAEARKALGAGGVFITDKKDEDGVDQVVVTVTGDVGGYGEGEEDLRDRVAVLFLKYVARFETCSLFSADEGAERRCQSSLWSSGGYPENNGVVTQGMQRLLALPVAGWKLSLNDSDPDERSEASSVVELLHGMFVHSLFDTMATRCGRRNKAATMRRVILLADLLRVRLSALRPHGNLDALATESLLRDAGNVRRIAATALGMCEMRVKAMRDAAANATAADDEAAVATKAAAAALEIAQSSADQLALAMDPGYEIDGADAKKPFHLSFNRFGELANETDAAAADMPPPERYLDWYEMFVRTMQMMYRRGTADGSAVPTMSVAALVSESLADFRTYVAKSTRVRPTYRHLHYDQRQPAVVTRTKIVFRETPAHDPEWCMLNVCPKARHCGPFQKPEVVFDPPTVHYDSIDDEDYDEGILRAASLPFVPFPLNGKEGEEQNAAATAGVEQVPPYALFSALSPADLSSVVDAHENQQRQQDGEAELPNEGENGNAATTHRNNIARARRSVAVASLPALVRRIKSLTRPLEDDVYLETKVLPVEFETLLPLSAQPPVVIREQYYDDEQDYDAVHGWVIMPDPDMVSVEPRPYPGQRVRSRRSVVNPSPAVRLECASPPEPEPVEKIQIACSVSTGACSPIWPKTPIGEEKQSVVRGSKAQHLVFVHDVTPNAAYFVDDGVLVPTNGLSLSETVANGTRVAEMMAYAARHSNMAKNGFGYHGRQPAMLLYATPRRTVCSVSERACHVLDENFVHLFSTPFSFLEIGASEAAANASEGGVKRESVVFFSDPDDPLEERVRWHSGKMLPRDFRSVAKSYRQAKSCERENDCPSFSFAGAVGENNTADREEEVRPDKTVCVSKHGKCYSFVSRGESGRYEYGGDKVWVTEFGAALMGTSDVTVPTFVPDPDHHPLSQPHTSPSMYDVETLERILDSAIDGSLDTEYPPDATNCFLHNHTCYTTIAGYSIPVISTIVSVVLEEPHKNTMYVPLRGKAYKFSNANVTVHSDFMGLVANAESGGQQMCDVTWGLACSAFSPKPLLESRKRKTSVITLSPGRNGTVAYRGRVWKM